MEKKTSPNTKRRSMFPELDYVRPVLSDFAWIVPRPVQSKSATQLGAPRSQRRPAGAGGRGEFPKDKVMLWAGLVFPQRAVPHNTWLGLVIHGTSPYVFFRANHLLAVGPLDDAENGGPR